MRRNKQKTNLYFILLFPIHSFFFFCAVNTEEYIHRLASEIRELRFEKVENLKEMMLYLSQDYQNQTQNGNDNEKRKISNKKLKQLSKMKNLDLNLTKKEHMISEINRFYTDLIEIDLQSRPLNDVLNLCENVLGIKAENLKHATSLLV